MTRKSQPAPKANGRTSAGKTAARGRPARKTPTARKKPPAQETGSTVVVTEEEVTFTAPAPPALDPAVVRGAEETLASLCVDGERLRAEIAATREALLTARAALATPLTEGPAAPVETTPELPWPESDDVPEPAAEEMPTVPAERVIVVREEPPAELPEVAPLLPTERALDAEERLVRHLDEAWAVKKAQVETFRVMVEDVTDPQMRAFLEEHRALISRQQEDLESRLQRLGKVASGGRGLFGQILAKIGDALRKTPDDADKVLQHLLRASGSIQLEAALAESLYAAARALDDAETADLAARHLREERAAAERLRPFLARAAVDAVSVPVNV
jgi:ferritin-like metal-binding protein YciE